MRWSSLAKSALPFVVSIALLTYLFTTVELAPALRGVTTTAASKLGAALAAFGGVSVLLEGVCLRAMLDDHENARLDLATAIRIKSASYLLNTINVGLGAGALSLLLRRRTSLALADAAGIVLLLAAYDFGLLLVFGAAGAASALGSDLGLRIGTPLAGIAILGGGLLLLRSDLPLGPLARLREMDLFRAARATPFGLLLGIGALRAVLVACFILVVWAALLSFGVRVPLGAALLGITSVAVVSSLPIAVSGLGTGQAAFLVAFARWADAETLLACSLSLSIGLIALRGLMGLGFAGEFTREALHELRGRSDVASHREETTP